MNHCYLKSKHNKTLLIFLPAPLILEKLICTPVLRPQDRREYSNAQYILINDLFLLRHQNFALLKKPRKRSHKQLLRAKRITPHTTKTQISGFWEIFGCTCSLVGKFLFPKSMKSKIGVCAQTHNTHTCGCGDSFFSCFWEIRISPFGDSV